ncbi:GNAT family N-acetyltransferase [Kitasatospora sp. MAA4]|uniref:GNAT family N-acetyltransferase n=1 Tax=Kitasatospora sp. MAA4 TaxID=3035093 RepID=UPI0024771CFA|nr:GNAT family N-acetyltransferase [Kitasatospora sp. MAA4]
MTTSTQADAIEAARPGGWALRSASLDDVEVIVELRAVVMRPDLVRLGRFDEERVRQRFRDAFVPEYMSIVLVDDAFAGCVALRPAGDAQWLEHFFLSPGVQGRGIGSAVLSALLERADADGVRVRLNVLQGSAARRLYERHGFTVETEDPVDVFMVREPREPSRAA